MKKRIIISTLAAAAGLFALASCGSKDPTDFDMNVSFEKYGDKIEYTEYKAMLTEITIDYNCDFEYKAELFESEEDGKDKEKSYEKATIKYDVDSNILYLNGQEKEVELASMGNSVSEMNREYTYCTIDETTYRFDMINRLYDAKRQTPDEYIEQYVEIEEMITFADVSEDAEYYKNGNVYTMTYKDTETKSGSITEFSVTFQMKVTQDEISFKMVDETTASVIDDPSLKAVELKKMQASFTKKSISLKALALKDYYPDMD